MHITFIGGGNMAGALIGGLLSAGSVNAQIAVVDPSETQRESLSRQFHVSVYAEASAVGETTDIVVLAVKPQQMPEVCRSIASLAARALVISVAAGIRTGDIARWLGGHDRIVRCMPNTPALIRRGVTALSATRGVHSEDRANAQALLGSVGATVWVDDEQQLDAVTAVSGSGPAYVFLFIEAMERGAAALGLNPEQARTLVLSTLEGATALAAQSSEPPAVLRERVTSKGGTTAAALATMFESDLPGIIERALQSACQRSAELGDEFGRL